MNCQMEASCHTLHWFFQMSICDYEDGLFYAVLISTKNHYPEFTIPIEDSWLNKPLSKSSFFVTHIIDQFNVDEIMRRNNTYLKARYFDYVVDEIIKNVIGGKDE